MGLLKANRGTIRFNATPRHDLSLAQGFGQVSEFLFDLYEDANNYLRLKRTTSLLTLAYNAQGAGEQSATWQGAWYAGVSADIRVEYGNAGVALTINGHDRITMSGPVEFASDFSQPIRWLVKQNTTVPGDTTIQGWQGLVDDLTPWWWGGIYTIGDSCPIWAVYEPCDAASFAASLLDKNGGGNDAIDPGGIYTPDWAAGPDEGWDFDATDSEHLYTTFVPSDDQSQTVFVQFSDVSNAGFLAGVTEGSGGAFFVRPNNGGASQYANGQTMNGTPVTDGTYCTAGDRGYANGVDEGASIGGWTLAEGTRTLWIGCRNLGGVSGPLTGKIQRMAVYEEALVASQVAAIHAAVTA